MLAPPSSRYGNAQRVLATSAVAVAHTGDTAEFAFASIAIPPNAIGLGQLEVYVLWTMTLSANNKSLRVRFGAANDFTGTSYSSVTTNSIATAQGSCRIANRTTASQVGLGTGSFVGFSTAAGGAITSAIDTTGTTFLVVSGTLANAGETITMESYLVKLVPGV